MFISQQAKNFSSEFSDYVHADWVEPLEIALSKMDQCYLISLLEDDKWLPGIDRIFAAFSLPMEKLSAVLFGESPYPRAESAVGICFLDGKVNEIYSENGLSKEVNKATSLRNLVKTALVAHNRLSDDTSPAAISKADKTDLHTNLAEAFFDLRDNKGVLLLNATPVLHPDRKPAQEAKFWLPFISELMNQIQERKKELPRLILWGAIAKTIKALKESQPYPSIEAEHPYNLSFIHNPKMHSLFRELNFLKKS